MPLDELLALYGYESPDPISEQESEGGDTAPALPDMTLDKVSSRDPGPGWGNYSVSTSIGNPALGWPDTCSSLGDGCHPGNCVWEWSWSPRGPAESAPRSITDGGLSWPSLSPSPRQAWPFELVLGVGKAVAILCLLSCSKEQIAKDLLSGEEEEETQSSADDLTPSVTSHEASDLFHNQSGCRCHWPFFCHGCMSERHTHTWTGLGGFAGDMPWWPGVGLEFWPVSCHRVSCLCLAVQGWWLQTVRCPPGQL